MNICTFDLETSTLDANTGIILCAAVKQLNNKNVKVIRADKYPNWKTKKSNNKEVVKDIMNELDQYDILIAHNGQRFDKAFLTALCLKYDIEPSLRFKKLIDPVLSARRHLKLNRNSLVSLIDFLDVPDKKTGIDFKHWIQASLDSNTTSMDYIVDHCVADVKALEQVYQKIERVIFRIDEKGSYY